MKLCLLSAPAADSAPLAAALAARDGLEVTPVLLEPQPGAGDGAGPALVGDLREERFDVAVACDWRATLRLFEVAAERYALLVPDLAGEMLDAADPARALAFVAIDLPLDLVAGSQDVAAELQERRPEARVLAADLSGADGGASAGAALAAIAAEPPPPAALLPRRLMADLDAALVVFGAEHRRALDAHRRLEADELVRASSALRAAYRSERMSRVRRTASPLVVAAKRRFGGAPGD